MSVATVQVNVLSGTLLTGLLLRMMITVVRETVVELDNSKPWQIALQSPNTSLVFGGFSPVSSVPFDHNQVSQVTQATFRK